LKKGRFTADDIHRVVNQSWHDFDALLPHLPKEPTWGSSLTLRLAALTLAFFRNLTAVGVEKKYAVELTADAAWKIFQWWGYAVRLISRLLRTDAIRDQQKHVQPDGTWPIGFPFNPPAFLARYVPMEDGLGFDVIRCPIAEYMRKQGDSDLAVGTWCMLDYALVEMLGFRLERSKTLAKGDNECNFRWFRTHR